MHEDNLLADGAEKSPHHAVLDPKYVYLKRHETISLFYCFIHIVRAVVL